MVKTKYPRAHAIAAAKEILAVLQAARVIIAGSLRRRKPEVGDIEIVYIPKIETSIDPSDLFASKTITTNHTDLSLHQMLSGSPTASSSAVKLLSHRANKDGHLTWGDKNKLAIHIPSGIPVDLFATTEQAWWNYLVCRTGSAENNIRISNAAIAKGWAWHPYKSGFTDETGHWRHAHDEMEVFHLAGLDYLEPWER